ncbi:DUF2262 domain-containing protein [Rossellomorea marisflavi]|uniref:DUF2262 domain-containing protein n=1 Tax=Rossellomorea marisflavi TaxID=189381 RepID=UPI003FA129FE
MKDYQKLEWSKQEHLHNVWELSFVDENDKEIMVSIFEVTTKKDINGSKVIEEIQRALKCKGEWVRKIGDDLSSVAKEWKGAGKDFRKMSTSDLLEAFQLHSILLDSQHHLTALYFDTTCFSGHQVVLEFNEEGHPFEAEISG